MIKVLFFASLREQTGHSQLDASWHEGMTPAQLWQQITAERTLPDNVLVARNQEYCDHNTALSDHDEVAFFPPVTGG